MKIEDIVQKVYNFKDKPIQEISLQIKQMIKSTETIRIKDLVNQLLVLAKDELISEKYNILSLTLISLLTALNFEISLAVCKKLKVQDAELYNKLVLLDNKLNSDKFFAELIKYSR